MLPIESKRILIPPSKKITDAFGVLENYDKAQSPNWLLYDSAILAINTLASRGLRASNQDLFELSAEKLLRLIDNAEPNTDNPYSHASACVINEKSLLGWYIQHPQDGSTSGQRQERSIKLLNKIFEKGGPRARKGVVELYNSLRPFMFYHMLAGKQGFDEALRNYLGLFPFTSTDVLNEIKELSAHIPTSKFRPCIRALLTSNDNFILEHGRDLANYLLSRVGVDGIEISQKTSEFWSEKSDRNNLLECRAEDVDMIFKLENKAPGLTEWLRATQGVKFLARYPIDLLLDQFNYKDDSKTPWGILVYPYSDHSGAFYEDSWFLSTIRSQINGLSKKYRIRIVEGEGLTLAKILVRLHKKYGPVSFGFIGGHGDKSSIEFGENFVITKRQLENGKGTKRFIQKLCPKDTPIILNSCLTGKTDGIAQSLSKLGLVVDAPVKSVHLSKIEFHHKNGRMEINATYHKAKKNRFKDGKLLKENK